MISNDKEVALEKAEEENDLCVFLAQHVNLKNML